MSNEATDGLASRCWTLFRVQRGRLLTSFPPASEGDPRRETPGSDSYFALEAWSPRRGHCRPKEDWCSQKGTWQTHKCPTRLPTGWHRRFLPFFGRSYSGFSRFFANERRRPEARNHGFEFPLCSQGLVFPDGDIAGPNSNAAFDPSLEYSADKVVLSWQPPSCFSLWSPLSFVVMTCHILARRRTCWAKRPGFSKTIEQWGSLCRRLVQAQAHASLEACATLTPVLGTGRSKTPCYLAPTPISRRIQPKQKHFLSSDNKLLTESSPLDPMWGISLRADGPRANNLCQGRGKTRSVRHFLPFSKLFATMRPGRRTWPPLVGSALALRLQEPRNLVGAAAEPSTAASARKASPLASPTYFSGALANEKP